jgi:hypothetical protein
VNDLDRAAARRVIRAAREQDLTARSLTSRVLAAVAAATVPHVGAEVMTAIFVDAAQHAWEARTAYLAGQPRPEATPADRAKRWEPEFGDPVLAFITYRTASSALIGVSTLFHEREELIAYAISVIDELRALTL